MTDLPPEVAGTTTRYLELIDKALPGRVTGFYLTGSVPLGDFRPGRSDIDGVVVVSEPVVDVSVVREVHEQLPSAPAFDVTYLTSADLAVAPDRGKPVVFTQDGVFKEVRAGGPVSPVLWSEPARQSIAVRTAPGLVVHDDQEALEAFTRDNLTSYWVSQFDQLESAADGKPDDEAVPDWVLPWVMLGVPRLHALLATGNIISKTAAGERPGSLDALHPRARTGNGHPTTARRSTPRAVPHRHDPASALLTTCMALTPETPRPQRPPQQHRSSPEYWAFNRDRCGSPTTNGARKTRRSLRRRQSPGLRVGPR